MIRAHSRIAITFGLVLILASTWLLQKISVSASATPENRALVVRARLSDRLLVHAARRGIPFAPSLRLSGLADFSRNPASAAIQDQSRSDVQQQNKTRKPPAPHVVGAAPANDNCANAMAINACPFTDTQDTTSASDEVGEPQSTCTLQASSVWYTVPANAKTRTFTVSTCNSDFDTALMVWQVDTAQPCNFASFVAVACNDDFCGDGIQSTVSFTAAPNTTYKIQVGGFDGDTGNLTTNVDCTTLNCLPVVINGTLGSGDPSFTGPQTSGNVVGRLDRNGIASTCAAPKVCSIFDPANNRAFDAYAIPNQSGQAQCVLVNLSAPSNVMCNMQSNAYLGSFNPASICTNYLADPGLSTGVPPTPTDMSFTVPAGQTLVVVVMTTTPGEIGCAYTVTVLGDLCGVSADLSIGSDAAPNPVLAGNNLTYTINFTNAGPRDAQNATVTDAVPANTSFVAAAVTTGSGWAMSAPSVGGTGNISFSKGVASASESAVFTLVVKVNPSTATGTTISNSATAASATTDPDNSNNTSTAITTVNTQADLAVTKSDSPDPVLAGNNLTYTITITNAGPSAANVVKLTDAVPAGTTFVALVSSGNCTTPPPGGTGAITCIYPSLAPDASVTSTLVVNVSSPPGSTITNTVTVTTTTFQEVNPTNDSATATTTVTAVPCAITCPANVTVNTSPSQCGAAVAYPPPPVTGSCGTVTCVPPAGSIFPRGSSTVTCNTTGGPSCAFMVTVIDNTPPVIACPGSIATTTAAGKNFAIVDYAIATATDACGVADVVCLPPSGATFPPGTSTVTCMAKDVANNTTDCAFTVTVTDGDAPSIHCPNNIMMELPTTQSAAIVNYPPPLATDNLPGVTASCVPPSGATFPLGISMVTCVAVDVTGNRATCGFIISLSGGPPVATVIIPTGKPALEFGTDKPTPINRKNKKGAKGPCAAFTIANRSFSTLNLTLDAIQRLGSDADGQRIADASEGDTYGLSIVATDGSETPLEIGGMVTVLTDKPVNFCLRFSPVLPGVAGNNSHLRALQVIPDLIQSRVTFRVAGSTPLSVNVNAIVETALHLINPNNPQKPATLTFTKAGDEFSVAFAVHDANLDVSRAKYEFLDASGAVTAGPFEVALTAAIRERNLVRGQSFTVTQRFTGANSNRQISAVRVTVFDGEASEASPIITLGKAAAILTIQTASPLRFKPVTPPSVRMDSPQR